MLACDQLVALGEQLAITPKRGLSDRSSKASSLARHRFDRIGKPWAYESSAALFNDVAIIQIQARKRPIAGELGCYDPKSSAYSKQTYRERSRRFGEDLTCVCQQNT